MDFSLDQETAMLKSSAEKYLKEKCPPSVVKELIKSESGFSSQMWTGIAELGWLGLTYDEVYGGFGMTFFDLFALFEEIGKAQFPSPFFTSAVISGFIIDKAGDESQKEKYLPSIINGEKIFSAAYLNRSGKADYISPDIKATQNESGDFIINGTRYFVPFAQVADYLIVAAQNNASGGGSTLFIVDAGAEGIACQKMDTLTEEKLDTVVFEQVSVPGQNVIGNVGEAAPCLDEILSKAIVLKCAEMLGGLDTVLKLTVEHVKTRHQFGKPLGTLQAVQHHCADLATFLESTRLISSQAAYLISQDLPFEKEVAMAKSWCSDAYKKGTWIAHQLHGGVGFTEEYDLHLYYKHAKAAELAFEDAFYHRSKVADQLGI